MGALRRADLVLGTILFLGTLGVFAGVMENGFVGYDDPEYVTANPLVRAGLTLEGVSSAFTEERAANWHPLTWLSHMLDVELFGLDAAAHHRTSLLLHALNALLLFSALRALRLESGPSFLVAALFAWHPLRVESVAWISERKDLLAGTFFCLVLLAHAWRARCPSARRSALVTATFALGLLAKPMLVTLPFVLLLLDAWPLGRMRGSWQPQTGRRFPSHSLAALVREKLPLLVVAGLSAWITLRVQSASGATSELANIALPLRLVNALATIATYVGQTVWPVGLACFYPHAAHVSEAPFSFLAAPAAVGLLLVLGLSALAWRVRGRQPAVATGWFWFLGMLVPVIGLVQVGAQSHADRYTYLPSIGLFLALAPTLGVLLARRPAARGVVSLAMLAVLAGCVALSTRQVRVWRDGVSLFAHALAVTRPNLVAHVNLGQALADQGDAAGAEEQLRAALAIAPEHPRALTNLGVLRFEAGDLERAGALFERARRGAPDDAGIAINQGSVFLARGDLEAAAASYERATALDPESALAQFHLGLVAERRGDLAEAERRYRATLDLDPWQADGLNNLGGLLLATGRPTEALVFFRRLVALEGERADAHYNLGLALEQTGARTEARGAYRAALERDPGLTPARVRLEALGESP